LVVRINQESQFPDNLKNVKSKCIINEFNNNTDVYLPYGWNPLDGTDSPPDNGAALEYTT